MLTVDARALWWHGPELCTCPEGTWERCIHDTTGGWAYPIVTATIDGAKYITDRQTLLPVDRIHGWKTIEGPLAEVRAQTRDGLAEWLTATPLPDPSDRVFDRSVIDPLEHAGFLLRPLEGVDKAHGICDPDLRLVGLTSPVPLGKVASSDVRAAGR